jgi:toxin FitB
VISPDTSVLVPALVQAHESHREAATALSQAQLRLVGHVVLETYSILTGRTRPRVSPRTVVEALLRLDGNPLPLSAGGYRDLLREMSEAGILGARAHDARVGATAAAHGLRLLSRDRRAARAYEAVGAEYELL